MLRAHSLFKFK